MLQLRPHEVRQGVGSQGPPYESYVQDKKKLGVTEEYDASPVRLRQRVRRGKDEGRGEKGGCGWSRTEEARKWD